MSDFITDTCDLIKSASADGEALIINGGNSKNFYGRFVEGRRLSVAAHHGVVDYEPSELVITVRGGTSLSEVEATLAEQGQMLPFEPPHYGDGATVGGTVACGFAGPARPYAGAVRDAVLGCRIINGFGESLKFGGQVMKNVAGYDVSRLMVGALGTLGVITEVSIKVVPVPVATLTLVLECPQQQAIKMMNGWAGQPLPISGTVHCDRQLFVRLSGTEAGIKSARQRLGGQSFDDSRFWVEVREQRHVFFQRSASLWRLSLPPATPPLALAGEVLLEWGGGQRWYCSDLPPPDMRREAAQVGGHATWFRGHDGDQVFHPLAEAEAALHRSIKRAFDPNGVLNPGRMHAA